MSTPCMTPSRRPLLKTEPIERRCMRMPVCVFCSLLQPRAQVINQCSAPGRHRTCVCLPPWCVNRAVVRACINFVCSSSAYVWLRIPYNIMNSSVCHLEIYMMLSVIGRLSAAFAQQVACHQVDVPDEVSSANLATGAPGPASHLLLLLPCVWFAG
jgi:hypothetical protein